jgi:quinol monooxygenase YgiN/quercetin dioxygenase-like cupin family protein
MVRVRSWVLGVLALAILPPGALAQDPVPLYPENYKVLLENDRVRVLDFRLEKGAKEEAHAHPAHVVYVITGFKVRFTLPGGGTRIRETQAGQVLYSEPVIHASENIGETDAHGILVELKTPPSAAGPTGGGAAAGEAAWLTAVTFIHGIPGREEELKEHLLSLEAPTRAEPGCVAYDLYRSADRPGGFLRFEVWKSPEDLEAHKATPHLAASFERRRREGWTTEITTWRRVRE